MARRQSIRRKPKKEPNRYDPNNPDWCKVHLPMFMQMPLLLPAGR